MRLTMDGRVLATVGIEISFMKMGTRCHHRSTMASISRAKKTSLTREPHIGSLPTLGWIHFGVGAHREWAAVQCVVDPRPIC